MWVPDWSLARISGALGLVCQGTWMCTPPPLGPDIHPNRLGYFVIALTLAAVLK